MVKVRLWGEAMEINRIADYLEISPRVKVKQRSDGYKDRGTSDYERVYMEIELEESATEIINRIKGGKQ